MDDQNNPQQPGHLTNPQQPGANQEIPGPQQYPQQPQQPQQFQPQYPAQQQLPQQQQPDASNPNPVNFKLIGMIVGGLAMLVIAVVIYALLAGGSSGFILQPASTESVPFSVSLPEGWEVTEINQTNLSILIATPKDAPENSQVGASVSLNTSELTSGELIEQVASLVEEIGSEEYSNLTGQDVTNLASDNFGTEEVPQFIISFNYTLDGDSVVYKTNRYIYYQSDGSRMSVSLVHNSEYADLEASAGAIIDSFVIN